MKADNCFLLPSKTFLIGEYAVLDGGMGILVSTRPNFSMLFNKSKPSEKSIIEGLSKKGPAIEFLKDHLDIFSNYEIEFRDPHLGRGGFGWSGAQFLFLYALKLWHEQGQQPGKLPSINRNKILKEYLSYAWDGEGWAPSGLDIVAQIYGGILNVSAPRKLEQGKILDITVDKLERIEKWPFTGIDFCLLRTGSKIATHNHLSSLKNIELGRLCKISKNAGDSLKSRDEEYFISSIKEFKEELKEQALVDPTSLKMIREIEERPEVLVAKGCGALGADVLLVILVKELKSEFIEWAESEDFIVVASSKSLEEGLQFKKKIGDTRG